ncbi:MAG: DUF1998 domain-containing protein [Promethearchaeota archaeon]
MVHLEEISNFNEKIWQNFSIDKCLEKSPSIKSYKLKKENLINCDLQFNKKCKSVNFVYAFYEVYSISKEPRIRKSIGIIDIFEDSELSLNSINYDQPNDLNQPKFEPLGPVGYIIESPAIKFKWQREHISNKIKNKTSSFELIDLIKVAISFNAALKLAISLELNCNLDDLITDFDINENYLFCYIQDNFEEGNGICTEIFDLIQNDELGFIRKAKSILNQNCCINYCENCILLPRTPPNYVASGLLDKKYGIFLFE